MRAEKNPDPSAYGTTEGATIHVSLRRPVNRNDVDTCHNQNAEPKAANGELFDVHDDASEESDKIELNEFANEDGEMGVASTATV